MFNPIVATDPIDEQADDQWFARTPNRRGESQGPGIKLMLKTPVREGLAFNVGL